MKYDYLIVGAGLFGSTFAERALSENKKCLIIDKRSHIAGNCYTEKLDNIDIHRYGPHIFHTNDDRIWNYVNKFCSFNNFINRPKVLHKDQIFSFPINLLTLYQLWGVKTPSEAQNKLIQVKLHYNNPKNLEEWILSQVGFEIYDKFIYGYTKKQWGTEPKNLPPFIIKRLPIRLSFDDNYYTDKYQGIPIEGYTKMIQNMIGDTPVELGVDYLKDRDRLDNLAHKVVYTGCIDQFFNYEYGTLDYRSLRFDTAALDIDDHQGNAIINYTDDTVPYTRVIEHKHFNLSQKNSSIGRTYITKEFPMKYGDGYDPFYPINNDRNMDCYSKYHDIYKYKLSKKFIFGGRLAEYRYYDMHQIIGSALNIYDRSNNIL